MLKLTIVCNVKNYFTGVKKEVALIKKVSGKTWIAYDYETKQNIIVRSKEIC